MDLTFILSAYQRTMEWVASKTTSHWELTSAALTRGTRKTATVALQESFTRTGVPVEVTALIDRSWVTI